MRVVAGARSCTSTRSPTSCVVCVAACSGNEGLHAVIKNEGGRRTKLDGSLAAVVQRTFRLHQDRKRDRARREAKELNEEPAPHRLSPIPSTSAAQSAVTRNCHDRHLHKSVSTWQKYTVFWATDVQPRDDGALLAGGALLDGNEWRVARTEARGPRVGVPAEFAPRWVVDAFEQPCPG